MNQPKESWSTPTIESLSVDLIRQQEEEILYHLLNSEEAFRLVTGTTSDYRLKEDKREYDAIALLQNIPTYDFRWKESGHREYGVMAHELQAVLPYLVFGEKNDIDESGQIIPQKVNYSKLVPILHPGRGNSCPTTKRIHHLLIHQSTSHDIFKKIRSDTFNSLFALL
jgi:hypothetical protein